MARISGVNLPMNKRIEVAVTYIYGIGKVAAKSTLKSAGINPDTRTKDLTEDEVNKLRIVIEKQYITEGELRRQVASNVRRLKEIGSFRGSRHAKGLPARGQRTKTNSRTVRGNKRVTMGSGRKEAGQKT
ncbi:30S ribosomal protein S13 [Candidatus Parcubacteria bacterium]|nr:30S ribosomal protein S13 [Patescibacteria group bacterium]MCG2693757.1 30S ribosomal protein S13 [Candidatus Parcubacteria bacterium]